MKWVGLVVSNKYNEIQTWVGSQKKKLQLKKRQKKKAWRRAVDQKRVARF